ncbi:MAG: transporter permease protein [Clostridiales bacterium]|jgi:putative ABC transport system permease protein|nr:transporter permease protein [Clostridiales bacterium]
MYFRMLKKDLRRKKTMNIILLIFIILAGTFISSSVNIVASIRTAMEDYFEKAELDDFLVMTIKEEKNDAAITEFLNEQSDVEKWDVDENLIFVSDDIKLPGNVDFEMTSMGFVSSFNIKHQKFFDSHNNEIKQMKDGEIYLPIALMEENNLKGGDMITVVNGDFSLDFTIVDNCKDALLGSTLMGAKRVIINDRDYMKLKEGTDFGYGNIYSIKTSNLDTLKNDFNKMGFDLMVACDQDLISMTYVMDMVMAGILLVVSICLIIISLVILRFTIVFTLNEEFREIGVMKAVGIKARRIRGLYILKYFVISVLGSLIGFFTSIPFADIFLKQVSKNIILTDESRGLLINFICSIFIIGIILLFAYTCTRLINKFSPIDAIRSGSNGERFKRKGFLRLSKIKMPTVLYMALNDILSGPKKFGVLIITFTIGIILVIVPINTINTLKGDKLVAWFGMAESDAYLVNEEQQMKLITEGNRGYIEDYLEGMESTLLEQGIDASVSTEIGSNYKISYQDKSCLSVALQGIGITANQYAYTEGHPPLYENEIALTNNTADKIGAKIGDTVQIKIEENEKAFIVTAFYQSMNSMGEGIRFSEKTEIDYTNIISNFAIQVTYNDNPSNEVKKERFEELKIILNDFEVLTGGEYITNMMGDIASQLEEMKQIIVTVIIIINMLVVVLMMKTFLIKEKGEIGMLKSIGFKDAAIIQWQVLRIGIVLLISTVLGALLSNPIAQISSGKIFEMMGATYIKFEVRPLEVYVVYPLIIFIMTLTACAITTLQIRKISAQETNNIE